MAHPGESSADEKTRACPTCRMMISVLATRCRFCGAEVGRPREETRSLTIDDLGGETIQHYVPSTNVMEAIEAFRAEEVKGSDGDKKGPKTRKTPARGTRIAEGLPDLDEKGRALANIDKGRRGRRLYGAGKSGPKKSGSRPGVSWLKYAVTAVGVLAGIAALYWGGRYAIDMVREYRATKGEVVASYNPAERMLRDGEAPDKTLEAAVKACKESDTPENRAILEQARKRMTDKVDELLNMPEGKWSEQVLKQAAQLAAAAERIDANDAFRKLKASVDDESRFYYMHLSAIRQGTDGEPVAVFKLADSASETEARKDEIVNGRFKVLFIGKDSARLADQVRNNRNITYDVFGAIR
ncbi:MAG TPA: hypothetical protein PLO62_03280 [Candidatus Hydrogenedentes bacterium]|nr:hypothetical protein [Candidatus Hydrogenedentota bacterium]